MTIDKPVFPPAGIEGPASIHVHDINLKTAAATTIRLPENRPFLVTSAKVITETVTSLTGAATVKIDEVLPESQSAAAVAAVASTLETALAGANNDLVFTARTAGVAGDDISVKYTNPGTSPAVPHGLVIATDGNAIDVHLATASASVSIASTAQEIMYAIRANDDARALVTVLPKSGNDGSGVVTALTATNLASGTDLVAATLETNLANAVNNDLKFTAVTAGTGGNSITVTYVDPAAIDQPLDVTVAANAITVSLATDGAGVITSTGTLVKNAVNADPEASLLVLVTNKTGNDGTGLVAAMAEAPLTGGTALVASTLSTGLTGTHNDLDYTAATAGAAGNSITIAYVNPGGATPSALSVEVTGTDIVVNLRTVTATTALSSTAAQVKAAIDAWPPSAALVSVANAAANDGTGIVTALAATNLTGGADAIAATYGVDGIAIVTPSALGDPAAVGKVESLSIAATQPLVAGSQIRFTVNTGATATTHNAGLLIEGVALA